MQMKCNIAFMQGAQQAPALEVEVSFRVSLGLHHILLYE